MCSSDPHFRGDATKPNPEDFLLASISSCHMLLYLHLCAGIIVLEYQDNPKGVLSLGVNEKSRFTSVTLNPIVTVKETSMIAKANELHKEANEKCFIANSLNFPVKHYPIAQSLN